MDKVAVAAATVTAVSGRVYQGKKRFAEVDSLEGNVRALTAETQGYFGFWLGPRVSNGNYHPGACTVYGELLVRLPKDTTSDVNSAYEVAEALCKALSQEATFRLVGKPLTIEYELVDDEFEDNVASFQFTMNYELPQICST